MKMTTKSGSADNLPASPVDRILSSEEPLIPSSGFVASVMEQINEEAHVPPPIAFPWRRAIPGIALAAGVFGWGGYEIAAQAFAAVQNLTFAAPHFTLNLVTSIGTVGWIVIALGLSLASWTISQRLAGQGDLL